MNLEWILRGLRVAVVLSGILGVWGAPLAAQQDRPAARRQDRTGLETPELRVKQQKADPELDHILRNWANATAKIEKLQGTHYRWVYDKVFEVEKRAEGKFYYEAPDKGRIDIDGRKILKGDVATQKGKGGKPYTLESAAPEKWICNGKEIQVIDDKEKSVEIVPIPKDAQGPNIMDGPLPFLFGMPPEKAKQRYGMKIVKMSEKIATLEITPLLRKDSENWRRAWVQLDLKEFLPIAVKLEDPSGNIETSYLFMDLEKNKKQSIFSLVIGEDVFQPKLRNYKKRIFQPNDVAGPPVDTDTRYKPGTVPSVLHMPAKEAMSVLKNAGYRVSYEAGKAVSQDEIVYTVYEQQPKAGTPLPKNETVRIIYYEHGRTSAKPPAENDDPPGK